MNSIYNNLQPSAANSFLPSSLVNNEEDIVVRPALDYFIIFKDEDEDENEEDGASEDNTILSYIKFGDSEQLGSDGSASVLDNGVRSKIGLVKGLNEFSGKFDQISGKSNIKFIDTERQRILINLVSESSSNFYLCLCINVGKIIEKKTSKIIYSAKNLSNSNYLIQEMIKCYKIFTLNYGSFDYNLKSLSLKEFRKLLNNWFKYYLENNFASSFNLSSKGFLNLFNKDFYKSSSSLLSLGSEKTLNLYLSKIFCQNEFLLEFFITENGLKSENNGLIYKYSMINKDDDNIKKNQISQDSIIDLLNYIEEIEIKYGLDKIILKNLPPSTHQEQHQQQRLEELRMHATNIATTYITDPLTQIVYAPINAVNNFSEYLPTWKLWGDSSNNDNDNNNVHDNNTNQISNEEHFSNNTGIDNVVVNSEIDKGRFIVGYSKTLENVEDETLNIISKIIYLNSNDQKNAVNECKLVVYNIMNFNIFLIYKSDYPLLNEVNFYQDLKKFLYEDVYKLHLQKINNITTNKISPNISNNENVVINISSSEPFYYILIDENGKTYQTSLPYILEHNKNDELDKSNKSQLMHVHNNLISFYMSLKSNNEQVNDDEVLVKSFRNWWFFYKKFDSNNDKFFKNKKLIILKKTNHTSKNDDIKRLFTTPNSRKLLFTKNDHVKRHNKTTDNNNFYNDNQEDLKNENSDFLNFLQNLGEDVWEWYLQYKNEGIL